MSLSRGSYEAKSVASQVPVAGRRPSRAAARCRAVAAAVAAAALVGVGRGAGAADATWNVDAAGSWATGTSWNPTTPPGATAGTTSPDTATFGTVITAARTVTVDANRNIFGINFAGNSSAYTLSGGNLLLTTAGTIQTSGAGSAHTDTISTAIAIQGDAGAATFTGGSTTATRLLVVSGGVTGVATGTNVTTLTLNGSNTGNNAVTGVVGNGAGGGALAVVKAGAGAWRLSGANTFTGGVTLSQGTLFLNNAAALGGAAGTFLIGGGTTVDNNSGAVQTISANNPITIDGDFTYGGTNTLSLGNGAVSLGTSAGTTRTITATLLTLTLGGNISNGTTANSIVKAGAGTLVFGGTNGYTGGTTINAGALQFNSLGATGASAARDLTIAAGTTAEFNFTGLQSVLNARVVTTSAGTVGINASQNIDFSAATGANLSSAFLGTNGTVTFTNTFTPFGTTYRLGGGGGTITFSAANAFPAGNSLVVGTGVGGTVALTAANNYDGGTTLNTGTLSFATGALGPAGLVTIAGASTLQWNGTNTQDVSPRLKVNDGVAATLDTNGNNVTLASAVQTGAAGTASVAKAGGGTLTLAAAQTYTGGTVVLGGTLAAGVTNPLPVTTDVTIGNNTAGAGNLDFTNFGATINNLNVTSNSATADVITIGAGKTLQVNGNVTLGSFISGTNTSTAATFTGPGTLSVTKTGGLFQVGGVVTAVGNGNSAAVDMSGLGTLAVDLGATGTFRVGDNNASGTGPSAGASTLKLAANSTIKAGVVGVSDTTSQVQTQTLSLGPGANVINANTISVAGSGNAAATQTMRGNGVVNFAGANGTVTVAGYGGAGTTADLNVANTNSNTSSNANVTGTVDFSGHVATLSLGAVIIGQRVQSGAASATTGSLTIDRAASVVTMNTLLAGSRTGSSSTAGANTGGTFTVNDGTVGIGTLVAPPAAGAARLGSNNPSGGSAGTATGTLQVNGGAVTIGANATSGTAVTLADSLVATHTATGVINITGGSLTAQGNIVLGSTTGLIGATTGVTLNGPTAVFDLTGRNVGTAAAQVPVFSLVQGTARNINLINGNGTAAANGITKAAAGTLSLDGTDAYTGPTAVSAGTLLVTGSLTATSSVSITGAATVLGGNGTIKPTGTTAANNVSIASGAVLAPGTSVGTLTIDSSGTTATNALALASGATLGYELNAGLQSDRVALVNGSAADVSFGGNTINFTDLSAGGLANGTYTLFTADVAGAYAGLTTDGGGNITGGLTIGTGLGAYPGSTLKVSGNNIVLSVVPEPGSAGLLAVAAAGLLARRRRRA